MLRTQLLRAYSYLSLTPLKPSAVFVVQSHVIWGSGSARYWINLGIGGSETGMWLSGGRPSEVTVPWKQGNSASRDERKMAWYPHPSHLFSEENPEDKMSALQQSIIFLIIYNIHWDGIDTTEYKHFFGYFTVHKFSPHNENTV